MKFLWKDYDPGADAFCEEWLDAEATRLTGLDDGWRSCRRKGFLRQGYLHTALLPSFPLLFPARPGR